MSYKYSVPDGHWDDTDEVSAAPAAPTLPRPEIDHQVLTTYWRTDVDERDMRYDVYVAHDDRFGPYVAFVDSYHQIMGSGQYDPDGQLEWFDLPIPLQAEIVDVIPGVDERSELDPELSILGNGGDDRAD